MEIQMVSARDTIHGIAKFIQKGQNQTKHQHQQIQMQVNQCNAMLYIEYFLHHKQYNSIMAIHSNNRNTTFQQQSILLAMLIWVLLDLIAAIRSSVVTCS